MSRKKDARIADTIERIRFLRISKNISIEELATRAKVSRSYIYYIETKQKIPTLTILFRLADAMGVNIEDFFNSHADHPNTCQSFQNQKRQVCCDNESGLFKILSFLNMYQKQTKKPDSLSWKEFYLLLSVYRNGSSSISRLAADLDIPVLDVSRIVSDLKSRTILQKKIRSSDRREVLSVLTDTGLMLLKKNEQIFRNFIENDMKFSMQTGDDTSDTSGFCSYAGRMNCSFKPLFGTDEEIVDLEFLEADRQFMYEFPKSRTLNRGTLLSRTFYQHFGIMLSVCNTIWKTGKKVSITLDTRSKRKGYTCEFFRSADCIIVSAVPSRKTAGEYIHELFPHYNYFFVSRPAKMVVDCATGKILEVNQESVRLYGWPRQEFLKKTIYEISTNRSSVVQSRLKSGGNNGDGVEQIFHVVHRLADGTLKKLEVHILSCLWGDRKFQYVTVIQDTSADTDYSYYKAEKTKEKKTHEDFRNFASKYENNTTDINELFDYLKENGKICCYSAGDHFFEYGTLFPTFGFILNGIFRVYYGTPAGHEYTLEYLHYGDAIDSLIFSTDFSEYEIIIEAVVPCKVLVVDQDLFRRRAVVDPHAFEFLYYLERSRLRKLEKHVMLLLTDTAKERYEQYMNDEHDFAGCLSGQDIASYLGITPETLSRIRNAD
ncbi:MAG: helix-turn-helix domain-containing protein [Treponema sp.]|nr:helix-turn-helix domain-containing protein [Treponema sp.]